MCELQPHRFVRASWPLWDARRMSAVRGSPESGLDPIGPDEPHADHRVPGKRPAGRLLQIILKSATLQPGLAPRFGSS